MRGRQRGPSRRQTAVSRSIPAPVGGWDAKNALADMPPENAVILDNWIPRSGYVEVRRGHVQQSTGAPAPVETLLVYRGHAAGSDGIFACAGSHIYDASTQGVSLSSVVAGLTSARFQSVNFANDAGHFLIAVNGADTPVKYDGSAWATTVITGTSGSITLDPTTLIDVMAHKRRLFLFEKNTLRVWYLAVEAIAGAAGLLDLGPVFQQGGQIICQASWTMDGGTGPDDYAVWITDQGEVAIYRGLDPSDANNWALVGVFAIGLPLGRRAVVNAGADLMVLTNQGVLPLSQALRRDREQDDQIAITDKIRNAFLSSAALYSTNFGWQGLLYPMGAIAIFNVPHTQLGVSVQYVQSETGAWCSFSGMNAYCWEVANGKAYFGASDGVYQFDVGMTDNGASVTYDLKGAFNDFGQRSRIKKFSMLRPILQTYAQVQPALEMLADYRESVPSAVPTVVAPQTSLWGAAIWGQSVWSSPNTIRYDWTSVTGMGFVGAVRMRAALSGASAELIDTGAGDTIITGDGYDVVTQATPTFDVPVRLIGFDVVFEPGGVL